MINQSYNVAYMAGLTASTKYFYQVGDSVTGDWSDIFSFKSAPDSIYRSPRKIFDTGNKYSSIPIIESIDYKVQFFGTFLWF
jgi:hypothetical protein